MKKEKTLGSGANVEIKARCRDPQVVRAKAVSLATECLGVDDQVDTYFATRKGRLKVRESSLSGGQLVCYLRPDQKDPKRSDYQVIPIADPMGLKKLLEELLGCLCVVKKKREILLYENVRIHLDRVDGLGDFMELEAVFDGNPSEEVKQQRKVQFLMSELGIHEVDLISTSYEGMTTTGKKP